MNSDEIGKVFVGGLNWETTKEVLREYFSQFGEVVDSVVMKNNETGRSRGFGFVTFKDPASVALALSNKPHYLSGKEIDAKECTPRSVQRGQRGNSTKVFLGGLSPEISEEDITEAMSKFGKVSEVTIMFDMDKKKHRGFGFLTFESEDSIQLACNEHFVSINGKQVECKRAEARKTFRPAPIMGMNSGGNQSWRNQGQGYQNWGGDYSMYQQQQPQQQGYGTQDGGYNMAPENWSYPTYSTEPGTQMYGQQQQQQQPQQQQQQQSYGDYAYPTNYNNASNDPASAQAQGMSQQSYGTTVNSTQESSDYGQTKNYGAYPMKTLWYDTSEGSGSSGGSQGDGYSSRNQNYHPYRR